VRCHDDQTLAGFSLPNHLVIRDSMCHDTIDSAIASDNLLHQARSHTLEIALS
jgi:hypothetical protein